MLSNIQGMFSFLQTFDPVVMTINICTSSLSNGFITSFHKVALSKAPYGCERDLKKEHGAVYHYER